MILADPAPPFLTAIGRKRVAPSWRDYDGRVAAGAPCDGFYAFAIKDLLTAFYCLESSFSILVAARTGARVRALIPEGRHGSRWFRRRAAATVLLLAAAGWPGFLSGCSGIAAVNEEAAPLAPDAGYRASIGNHLRRVFKNSLSYDSFEISDPRWVHSIKGWNWLTCVRFQDRGHLRTYAVFHNGGKIVDDRFAVQTDNCDAQVYSPMERPYWGLDPLH